MIPEAPIQQGKHMVFQIQNLLENRKVKFLFLLQRHWDIKKGFQSFYQEDSLGYRKLLEEGAEDVSKTPLTSDKAPTMTKEWLYPSPVWGAHEFIGVT